jgi:hemerythrin-like domain-containing protein
MSQQAPSARADVRTYKVVHQAFRLATNRLVDATERLDPSALQPVVGSRWGFYDGVLHHHHHSEDDSIFPALLAVRPDLHELVQELEQDHRELLERIAVVDRAVTAFEQQPDADHQSAVHDAIVTVREAFFPHLDVEDAQIIPAIEVSVDPNEWDRIDTAALKSIPKQYLPMAVGAIDEMVRGLPDAERPPPPPVPVRVLLAISWRRKWADWLEPLRV